ncbi:MAG TPA: tetratricopeptide repeat protein [Candidatus Binataceae bacterium]|nr:tetratricopeptide repeat protein [Candidatus Binataceae bacterium]
MGRRSHKIPAMAVALVIMLGLAPLSAHSAAGADNNICDPLADYYLGLEDYPKTLELHQAIIRKHPDFALAYYHLGFVYGALGDRRRELADYQKAVDLGLNDWDLFLNLGRLYFETGHFAEARGAFRIATLLGPYRPETHYNLGLAYEQTGELQKAEQEILQSLRIKPHHADARNTLATIYAEEGNYARAHEEWEELSRADPAYQPAEKNLAILRQVEGEKAVSAARAGNFAKAP